jgi:tetratricopeptide (TPR) repeat protein
LFKGWRRAPQGVAGHPLYRLATQVQRGKLTLAAAIARIDATSELRDLADSQLIELDRQIGQLSSSNRNLAHTLASLNYAVARAKGFRRVQVDCALRLSELTYDTHTRLNLLHEALTASQKSGYRRGEKVAQATLGKLYTQEGRGEDAIAAYRDQLESAKSGGYAAIDVESLLALGDLYREQNQLDEALETFERTVNAAGAAGQPSGQIEALTRAAEIYFLRGTPTAALDALDRGLVIAVDLKDARVEAELASLYGDLLRELRRIGEAATA